MATELDHAGHSMPRRILEQVNLLVVDGIEFVKRFRTAAESPNPYVPIVMRTGHTDSGSEHAARGPDVTAAPARSLYLRLFRQLGNSRHVIRAGHIFHLTGNGKTILTVAGQDGISPTPPTSTLRQQPPVDNKKSGGHGRSKVDDRPDGAVQ